MLLYKKTVKDKKKNITKTKKLHKEGTGILMLY